MGRSGCLELKKVVASPCSLETHQQRGGSLNTIQTPSTSVLLGEEVNMAGDKKSCKHQQLAGNTFFGTYTYFSTIGKPNKEIPKNVVAHGRKFWPPKT